MRPFNLEKLAQESKRAGKRARGDLGRAEREDPRGEAGQHMLDAASAATEREGLLRTVLDLVKRVEALEAAARKAP